MANFQVEHIHWPFDGSCQGVAATATQQVKNTFRITTMVEPGQGEAAPPTSNMSTKKKELLSTAMKRTSDWIFSQEIPSDVTIHAGGSSFSLHKFPLVSKCGYIRKIVSEASDADVSVIEITDVPGGAEAFELAAKFCYGINFEISSENIAMLRCVAEYLEMTEDYAVGNLVSRTEDYFSEVTLNSLAGAISVLHQSENLFPMAEKVKLVGRCIDAVAYIACKNSQFSLLGRTENRLESVNSSSAAHLKTIVDWWAEDLTILRIDIFQRVLIAILARGFKKYALGPVLMLYAQKSLRGLEIFGKGRKNIEPNQEHEKRIILETIVSLLPSEKNAMSVSFLSMLLRAAIYLETTVACRLDLEKRMGLQLGQAVLDDLLIPSFSFAGDTLFDVDTVRQILMNYIEYGVDSTRSCYNVDDEYVSPPTSDLEWVGKLMESYLAEIASDRNLSVSRFISLAELIPEQARITEDGMYRAIDIYLKTHPALSEMERKKVCSLMDCQKLSREACAHVAQNDRLPVQTVVQVLYYEQQRLRDVMNGSGMGEESPGLTHKLNLFPSDYHPAHDELSRLRRENEELKIELVRMQMRLKELEKSVTSTPSRITPSANKPPLPRKSFINSMSKKLGRLSSFVQMDGVKPSDSKSRTKPSRDRRHSIS
ncbi:BTB/POZ domain-containing protein SR1IP1-like isoform X2 [Macadamia integrifolia]|uniref:BTB/POZ domain-containing protein SR1IP1-like isoform X2 n=1 Tax=Macadamia integrifolia TaxID=60698 RepID=UPI001C4F50A6|nr:BTB/POZ domain-containing protein SR1IP1-like isoform X2 [Macadamia integrifolia]